MIDFNRIAKLMHGLRHIFDASNGHVRSYNLSNSVYDSVGIHVNGCHRYVDEDVYPLYDRSGRYTGYVYHGDLRAPAVRNDDD